MRQSDRGFVPPNAQSLFEQIRRQRPELAEREAITLLCEQILSEAEAEPPVPVERIASLRGIARICQRDQQWAGTLRPEGKNLVVDVRASDGYERQRFTICHESGHTFFAGFAEQPRFRCNGERTTLEQRCDIAATEFLLPRRFFLGDIAAANFELETVEQLAIEYEASIEATALRVSDLWPGPSSVLVLRERHKPTERGREDGCESKLRLDYSVTSGEWPFLRRFKSVSPESPFGRAFAGELIDEVGALGELSDDTSKYEIHARRYGHNGRVIALVRPSKPLRAKRSGHAAAA
jgi:hypothetical protein